MARRASRLTRGGSPIAFQPSGVTISGSGVDFGQGTKKLVFSGVTALGLNKTALSVGTIHFLTGMTTVETLMVSFRYGLNVSTVTPTDGRMITKWQWEPSGKAGGATLYLQTTNGGATNNLLIKASGSSLYWQAIGT